MSGMVQDISNTMRQYNVHSSKTVTLYMSRNLTFCLGMPLNTPCSLCATVTSQNSWMWEHTRLSGDRCAWLASACCHNRYQHHITTDSWQNRKSIYSTKLVLGLWDFRLLPWCKWGLRSSATLHSTIFYFVLWPTKAQVQLICKLSHFYMFQHYHVILRELVISTSPSYTSISNAAVGNKI